MPSAVHYPTKTYMIVRLIAQVLLLLVLERGYHVFHFMGSTFGEGWGSFGYIWGPLCYTALVVAVLVWHRKWLTARDMAPLSFSLKALFERQMVFKLVLWFVLALALIFVTNWGWAKYWERPIAFDGAFFEVIINFNNWQYFNGLIRGTLLGAVFYLSFGVKIYIALQIGNLMYHMGKLKSEGVGRIVLALGCLLTFGLSETLYFGSQNGAQTLFSTAIALVLTLANPRHWMLIWLYIMASVLI